MTKNNKQFFIPKWFSQSFKRYLITMMLFTIVGLLFSSQTNKKFDMTSDIEIFKAYHKYLKQMTSKII